MSIRIAAAALGTVLAAASAYGQDAGDSAPPLFELAGKTYAPEDLSARMQNLYGSVLADQYRQMQALVDEMVFDVHVEREAARSGRPVQEVGAELLAVPEPDDAAVNLFYQQNRERIAAPLEQVEADIRRRLKRSAQLQRREEILERIKNEGGFVSLLEPPPLPPVAIDTRGRPVKGDPSAPITIVEFADFQCPNCARAVSLMRRILEDHAGKVKLVHMDFPINRSGISRVIAHGGVCAQAQGRFWDYHDLAYSRQGTLHTDAPTEMAEELALDLSRFEACMKDSSTARKVVASENQARRLGVNATPTIFVDGKPFVSNHLLRDMAAYVAKKTGG